MGYFAPRSLDDALSVLAAGNARVLAGGTDFFPAQGRRPIATDLVDLTGIAELRGVTQGQTGWRIGAATPWSDVIKAPLPPAFDALKEAAREVGSVQIQNVGTVAGNLCNASPAADGVPPLLTLDASIEIASRSGRRHLPLDRFLTGVRQVALDPGEIVVAFHVPATDDMDRSAFLKLGSRRYLVISIAMVAVLLRLDGDRIADARIAVGACSPVARRLPTLERVLIGQDRAVLGRTDLVAVEDLASLNPIDDVRASAAYRMDAAAQLITRALHVAANRGGANG
ncbi:MAG: xanthine dehydrogenase family protein subunit M [Rhodobacteraceae bacterium]|nr:xanthine dehydrogenase family protein subunit M [Paracoccaceae bacterium]